jgi:hypothetical protein
MQTYFGVTPPTVHQMVLSLGRNGLIGRKAGMARSIRLLDYCCRGMSCRIWNEFAHDSQSLAAGLIGTR